MIDVNQLVLESIPLFTEEKLTDLQRKYQALLDDDVAKVREVCTPVGPRERYALELIIYDQLGEWTHENLRRALTAAMSRLAHPFEEEQARAA